MKKPDLKTIALLVAVFSGWGAVKYFSSRVESKFPQGDPATLEKINRVKPGMTVAQVQAIFVVPGWTPKSSSPSTVTEMSWTNHNLSGVGIIFENGRVINIVRSGDLPQEEGTE